MANIFIIVGVFIIWILFSMRFNLANNMGENVLKPSTDDSFNHL